MLDLKAVLFSAKRLEDEYRLMRQHVALERLGDIQEDVAQDIFKQILDHIKVECDEIGGFLADALKAKITFATTHLEKQ